MTEFIILTEAFSMIRTMFLAMLFTNNFGPIVSTEYLPICYYVLSAYLFSGTSIYFFPRRIIFCMYFLLLLSPFILIIKYSNQTVCSNVMNTKKFLFLSNIEPIYNLDNLKLSTLPVLSVITFFPDIDLSTNDIESCVSLKYGK
jgi:hypothetical protein